MNATSRILGEAVRPPTKREKTDSFLAYQYARYVLKGRFPEGEVAIATQPECAYLYARDVIKGRWPEAEPAIATSPQWAYRYAKYVLQGRFPEAEKAIATHPTWAYYSAEYLKAFPEAKLDWAMNGLIDWTDL